MKFDHFNTINYLKNGNTKQQLAFKTLSEQRIIEKLQQFTPILVGTIPIEIDIASSDLDIICCFQSKELFTELLIQTFNKYDSFTIKEKSHQGTVAVIANFFCNEFEIEVFGQTIACKQQNAYRHMIIEHNLLQKHGAEFRQQIIDLKNCGIKTEPAFAKLLGLKGDPYQALLKLERNFM